VDAHDLHVLVFSTLGGVGSVVGTLFVVWREAWVRRWSTVAVAVAAGAMATTALTHLLPEAVLDRPADAPLWTLAGFAGFFLLNQLVSFHSCGRGPTHVHPIGVLALVGICFHSLFDGVAIGAAFGASETAGRVVTGAVFAHEVPEGAYTFAILLHAGMSYRRALVWSVVQGAITPIGAMLTLYLHTHVSAQLEPALLGLSAGTFLYVAASNLVPETLRESGRRNAFAFLAGIGLVMGLGGLARWVGLDHHHGHAAAPAHEHAPAEGEAAPTGPARPGG
jgi:zinc and cadmium transporter